MGAEVAVNGLGDARTNTRVARHGTVSRQGPAPTAAGRLGHGGVDGVWRAVPHPAAAMGADA